MASGTATPRTASYGRRCPVPDPATPVPDEPMTPAQLGAAQKLAQETLGSDHLAIERYARMAVPDA